MKTEDTTVAGSEPGQPPTVRLRIWPAVLIALAQLAAAWGFGRLATTNIHLGLVLGLIPLVSTLLMLAWWLAGSRAPWRDRLMGAAVFIAAAALVACSQKKPVLGGLLLALALPAFTLTLAAMLVLTCRLAWRTRRWLLALALFLCAGVFCARRVESIGGDLVPIVKWRWTATAGERSTAVHREEPQGTAALPAKLTDDDWPGFRGPGRDGRVAATGLSLPWAEPPRELWRRAIGPAWSSFAAVGDYLFTQEQRGTEELVTCYQAGTGQPVWVNRVAARFEDNMGLGPRATPTYDRGRLYTQGCTGILQCLDAATGKTLWKRNLTEDTGCRVPGYGVSGSPLIVRDLVIQFSCAGEGKTIVAYRRETGEIAWRAGHGTTVYSSPHLATLGGMPQILMVCNYGLQAFAPDSGALLWDYVWKVGDYPRCTQPLVVDGDKVLLGATGTTGSRLFQVTPKNSAWNVAEVWFSKQFRPYFNDAVEHKGHCYGFDGERLVCLDLKSGEKRWAGARYGGQLLLVAEKEMLLVLTEKGQVVLVRAVPEAFSEVASFQALTGKTWNHPVIAHGKLFVRNAETAACYELAQTH
jgi:outer membrane protein assembly factor BamB